MNIFCTKSRKVNIFKNLHKFYMIHIDKVPKFISFLVTETKIIC